MKKIVLILLSVFSATLLQAQTKLLYNPAENAEKEIEYAVMVAKSQGKHVLLAAGGNWCTWCIEFDRFSKTDSGVNTAIKNNYVVYHLNWSKENENKKIFAKYGFPQRFGFPVFIILNAKGERIHTQNSEYLENGKRSYDVQKVKNFLEMWTSRAIDKNAYGM
jgi:thioredoxin-related protein